MQVHRLVPARPAIRRWPLFAFAGLSLIALGLCLRPAFTITRRSTQGRAEPPRELVGPPSPVGVWVHPPYHLEERSGCPAPRSGFWDLLWHDPEPDLPLMGIPPSPDRTLRYDGDTVYMKLFDLNAPENEPEDLIFRLRAEWRGNALYAQLPSGQWKQVATFVDGHFRITNEYGRQEVLQLADPGEEYLKPFLKERPVWHPSPPRADRGHAASNRAATPPTGRASAPSP
jgi:hypothetical protein